MRLFKFLHLIGLAGFAGGLAAQLLLARIDPPSAAAAEAVSRWLTGPALLLLVASGLMGIAARPAWLEERWMLAKLLLMLVIAPAAWFGAGSATLGAALGLAIAAAALGVWRPGLRAH
ncbi:MULTISPECIES: hypothetical protein [unclassified Variovorax]|uniref:hypothetical protein n=1 Tax=unclassified Variovorax TaxID=663243 RepID=UPI003F48D5D7